MKVFSKLSAKFAVVLAIFIGLAGLDYLVFVRLVRDLRNSAPAVNLAGRQRYLAQKTAYACFMVYAGHGEDAIVGKTALEEFGAALAALEEGGAVGGITIAPVPAAMSGPLEKQKAAWSAFRGPALLALEGAQGRPGESEKNLRRVEELTGDLIAVSEELVGELQRNALHLVDRTRGWLLAVVLANLLLALFTFWLALLHIAAPVKRMAAAADSFAAGDYRQPDIAVSGDEIGVMELSFRRMAKAIGKDRDMRQALRALFELSLQQVSMEHFLSRALDQILSLPWLAVEPQGAIFLAENGEKNLVMKARRGLPGALAAKCARLAPGQCLCGRAALAGTTLYAADMDERHENTCDGLLPHGHYCVPIKSGTGLLGVFTVYLGRGHARSDKEVLFLESAAALLGNIIEKKLAEAEQWKLAEVLRQASEAVFITETGGKLVYVNKAFEKMTGYAAVEALGRTPSLLKSGSHEDRYYREMWVSMEKGVPWIGRIVNKRKDGSLVEVQSNIFPVKNAAGQVVNYVAIQEDLSSRAALEEQLRQAQKMEAVGRLAGGVAHDFNNMLSAMGGYAHLMTGKVSGQAADDLEEIKKAVGKAAGLTRQLLAFSRKQQVVMQPLDLGGLLKENEKMLGRLIGERFRLEINSVPGLKPVRADRGQVEQALMNLVVNGADAMPAGGRITVSAAPAEMKETLKTATGNVLPGEYTVLSVRDAGGGIQPANLPNIFDPFFTTKPKGKGTGLGLSIVHGIAQQHNAHIAVESVPGSGTEFRLYFPAASEAVEPASAEETAGAALPAGISVLVVDDDGMVRNTVARSLIEMGAAVTAFEKPAEALAFLAGPGKADLLLTDVVMPEMDGLALGARAAQLRPGLKIIFMSGYADPDVFGDGLLRQGAPLLHKPFSIPELAAMIDAVLGRPCPAGPENRHLEEAV